MARNHRLEAAADFLLHDKRRGPMARVRDLLGSRARPAEVSSGIEEVARAQRMLTNLATISDGQIEEN